MRECDSRQDAPLLGSLVDVNANRARIRLDQHRCPSDPLDMDSSPPRAGNLTPLCRRRAWTGMLDFCAAHLAQFLTSGFREEAMAVMFTPCCASSRPKTVA